MATRSLMDGLSHSARRSAGVLAVSLLPLVNGTCDHRVRETEVQPPCVTATPATVTHPSADSLNADGADKFLPPYKRILECTGWLEYVDLNVDVVRYYDMETFQSAQGPAIGLARYESGRRIADVAIKGQTDIDIVSVIVHEAAHLSGIRQLGTYLDQAAATTVQRRFLVDAAKMTSGDARRQSPP